MTMAVTAAAVAATPAMMDGLFGSSSSSSGSTSTDPFKTSSGLGTSKFDGANTTLTLSDPFKDAQDQFLGQSMGSLGQLGAFGNNPFQASQPYDLQGFTQNQFNLLEGLQQPSRDQATLDLEERLFSQGRLGSTGGTGQQNSLQDQFSLQQAQNMQSAFGQGLQGQQQQFGQDLEVGKQRLNQQKLLASLGTGLFGSALAPEQALLNQFQTGGAFAPTKTETESSDDGWF
tara:strand:+ start:545 stop:1234 length:690 start_codon:yes stop_codon:yes gene_type:complete